MLRLIKPTARFKKAFIAGDKEFPSSKQPQPGHYFERQSMTFDEFIKKARDYEKGKSLPKGYVPATYYWLMHGSQFIGEATIRHKLNKSLLKRGGHIGYGIRPSKRKMGYGKIILKLALKKAAALGIKKALVTCNDKNIGSYKIIEANGGILQNKIRFKRTLARRYWISTHSKRAVV
jgi:predicted acetyltransferase